MTDTARDYDVHTAAYWLKKAAKAHANAEIYPDYRNALESLAEQYEQLAERTIELETRHRSSEQTALAR